MNGEGAALRLITDGVSDFQTNPIAPHMLAINGPGSQQQTFGGCGNGKPGRKACAKGKVAAGALRGEEEAHPERTKAPPQEFWTGCLTKFSLSILVSTCYSYAQHALPAYNTGSIAHSSSKP
jgi:hypothetical protein